MRVYVWVCHSWLPTTHVGVSLETYPLHMWVCHAWHTHYTCGCVTHGIQVYVWVRYSWHVHWVYQNISKDTCGYVTHLTAPIKKRKKTWRVELHTYILSIYLYSVYTIYSVYTHIEQTEYIHTKKRHDVWSSTYVCTYSVCSMYWSMSDYTCGCVPHDTYTEYIRVYGSICVGVSLMTHTHRTLEGSVCVSERWYFVYIGLFWVYVGLLWVYVGLFWLYIGSHVTLTVYLIVVCA